MTGRILFKQYVELTPGSPTTLTHEVARGTLENGVYDATIPAYDSVLPVLVEVSDHQGHVIASAQESVRQSGRGLPFVVMAGSAQHFDDTEAVISVSELPTDWWAYDPVLSLWIAAPVTDRNAWQALGEWVSSGGSLVIFSGSDFYKWDSPLARSLLPITNPTLLELEDGSSILSGSPRVGTAVLLAKEGEPLLLRWQYAGGFVTLVTARIEDLNEADLQRIAVRVPGSSRLGSPDRLGEAILNQTPVLRPMYAFAPVVVLLLVGGVCLFYRLSARRLVLSLVGFGAFIGLLSVGCGFYTNHIGRMAYQYRIITDVRVQTSFGISSHSYAFFALDPTAAEIEHEAGSFPIQASFQTTRRAVYGLQSDLGVSYLPIPARTRRFVRTNTAARADVVLYLDSASQTAHVVNEGGPVLAALLFSDGLFYALPPIDSDAGIDIAALRPLSSSAMNRQESRVYAAVSDWLVSCPGTWILTYREHDQLIQGGGLPTKVSLVEVQAVEGVES
jgi:hypothetical protein